MTAAVTSMATVLGDELLARDLLPCSSLAEVATGRSSLLNGRAGFSLLQNHGDRCTAGPGGLTARALEQCARGSCARHEQNGSTSHERWEQQHRGRLGRSRSTRKRRRRRPRKGVRCPPGGRSACAGAVGLGLVGEFT